MEAESNFRKSAFHHNFHFYPCRLLDVVRLCLALGKVAVELDETEIVQQILGRSRPAHPKNFSTLPDALQDRDHTLRCDIANLFSSAFNAVTLVKPLGACWCPFVCLAMVLRPKFWRGRGPSPSLS